MRTLIALLALALLPLAVAAQSQVVRTPVCSIWAAWSPDVKHNLAAAPLQLNALGNLTVISGQRVAIGAVTFLQPTITVTFKGPAKSSASGFTVVAIRAYHEVACQNISGAERPVDVMLSGPLLVPPGQPFTCRYDTMPAGEVICQVGASVTIPPPVLIPGVPSTPPPVVTPPPAAGVSPDGTKMPPASELIDGEGAKWTTVPQTGGLASQVGCRRNGAAVNCNSVDFLTIKAGVIYQSDFGSGAGWSRWSGGSAGSWVASPAP
jgi:hypothetical protein